jgi:hypothetical protein
MHQCAGHDGAINCQPPFRYAADLAAYGATDKGCRRAGAKCFGLAGEPGQRNRDVVVREDNPGTGGCFGRPISRNGQSGTRLMNRPDRQRISIALYDDARSRATSVVDHDQLTSGIRRQHKLRETVEQRLQFLGPVARAYGN